MSPRQSARLQDMNALEVAARAEIARKFLDVAQLVDEDPSDASLPSVTGALCVLAGIAASDAICGHVLKQRSRGQDHAQAVTVLRGIRGADEAANALARLLADKDASQYGTTFLSAERARQMLRRASTLVEAMDERLRQGPSTPPATV